MHLLSILAVAPELAADFDMPGDVVAALGCSREGNARGWTLRVAHGVIDFLLACLPQPASIAFFNVAHADPTDREFIATLIQRADPATLSIRNCLDGDSPAALVDDAAAAPRAFLAAFDPTSVTDDETLLLLAASDRCMHLAYYDAALEWAGRGLTRVDPVRHSELFGKLMRNVLFATLLLGRYDEAAAICDSAQQQCADPALSIHLTYARAILNARFYDVARRDYAAAQAWVERSLACTDLLPATATRAVNHSFLLNTMALVEMRKGRGDAALALIDAALDHMAKEAPDAYRRECIILLHNRARLHVAADRGDEAIADLTRLLAIEPSNSDAYFDRGLLHQRSGQHEAALLDYDSAIRWSPPYWEPHFNRAQVLTALGRSAAAIADYDRVCVLHPGHSEALINRSHLHLARGDLEGAERDAAAVLRTEGNNARALCLRGLVALRRGEIDLADRDLSAAILADPSLADAWANRATIHFKAGELDRAMQDIDRAAALREDADILYNRGRILEALERWDQATANYRRILERAPGAADLAARRLEVCDRRRPAGENA